MADQEMDLTAVKRLIELVESRDLTELVVEDEGVKVTIRGSGYIRPVAVAATSVVGASTELVAPPDESGWVESEHDSDEEEEDDRIPVVSPVVGVFYRTSGPDAAPYVEIGDRVEVGQIIGLIEAMKVFSEVPSEAAGTVVGIAASNGQLVRVGDPLIYLGAD